jgi:hypothetical protein
MGRRGKEASRAPPHPRWPWPPWAIWRVLDPHHHRTPLPRSRSASSRTGFLQNHQRFRPRGVSCTRGERHGNRIGRQSRSWRMNIMTWMKTFRRMRVCGMCPYLRDPRRNGVPSPSFSQPRLPRPRVRTTLCRLFEVMTPECLHKHHIPMGLEWSPVLFPSAQDLRALPYQRSPKTPGGVRPAPFRIIYASPKVVRNRGR